MAQDTNDRPNAFPAVTLKQWQEKAEADLKGASLDSLASEVAGGIPIEPVYAQDNAVNGVDRGAPGVAPFVRGATALPEWVVRQEYIDPRADVCGSQIQEDLARGAEAIWVCLGPHQGCRILSTKDLGALFSGVDLAKTSVCLEAGPDTLAVAAGFVAAAKASDVPLDELRGCYGADPLGSLLASGALPAGLRMKFREQADLAGWSLKNTPGMRAVLVSAHAFNEAGCTEVQELAWAIATGVEYVRNLVDAGLSCEDAMGQTLFAFSISGDFFAQIAKLRAARWLWAKVGAASGVTSDAAVLRVHARTSYFTKSRRDPWVNMLRTSAECTAAALGGAQSIATVPFDVQAGPSDELSRRIARNTQTVLREESHLSEVADPAGGSWYIESLTEQLARAAWSEFQRIEKAGGMQAAIRSGEVTRALQQAASKRASDVARRKASIVGVNEFPDLGEPPVQRAPVDMQEVQRTLERSFESLNPESYRDNLVALAQVARDKPGEIGRLTEACVEAASAGADFLSMAAVLRHGHPDFHTAPLELWHAAEPWERLRDAADHAEEHGARPVAYLTNLGSVPSHKARSAWARNLLSAAGIASISNDGHTEAKEAATAWRESTARMAVVCGADADYESMLHDVVTELKAAGCPLVLVAGKPGERERELRDAGVSDFVYLGADLLSVMSLAHEAMGVGT